MTAEKYYENLIDRCAKAGRIEVVGKTRLGYDIPMICGGGKTLLVGAVHAREHITAELLLAIGERFGGKFDIVPCLNIDGTLLCKFGAGFIGDEEVENMLVRVNGGRDFSLWKANAACVDINVNFDAEWGKGRQNVRFLSSANYIGEYPESEPETRAAAELVRSGKYSQIVCYHTKGEVVYWGFGKNHYHRREAERYAESINYPLLTSEGSAGGLKDYFDSISDGLGLTVEVGADKFPHPYPESELDNLAKRHFKSVEILYENGESVFYGRGNKRGESGV